MNKLTLNEIVGYLPYGLKIQHNNKIDVITGYYINSNDIWITTNNTGHSIIDICNPILNRIEDMSKEQLEQQYFIQSEFMYNIPLLTIELSRFYYSLHIDIHNLIDRGLAVDAITLNTPTNVK